MGRYTQRRRASGGPAAAGAAPPPSLTITAVQLTFLGTAVVTFSTAVNFTSGVVSDGALTLNGNSLSNISGIPASPSSTVTVNYSGSASPGDPWVLSSQPGWLTDPVAFPDSGALS